MPAPQNLSFETAGTHPGDAASWTLTATASAGGDANFDGLGTTPWTVDAGTSQGRIKPRGWPAVDGDYVFVLGQDVAGVYEKLAAGDHVDLAQTADLTGINIVRFAAHVRPSSQSTAVWHFALLIDGALAVFQSIVAGRERTRVDIGWDVAHLTGSHTIAFRLELDATPTPDPLGVELPGVYIDRVVLDTSTARPILLNRDPEPNEIGAPLSAGLAFDLVDIGAAGIDTSALQVFVDGVLALSGTSFQTGFSGALSAPQTDTYRVSVVPGVPWASNMLVTVRVVAQTVGGVGQIDQTYTFTTVNLTPPEIVSAFAPGEKVVWVRFSEPLGVGATTVSNYVISLVSGAPAVTPAILSSSLAVDVVTLALDMELTPGAVYAVTATDVEDLLGNAVAAPTNTSTFLGFIPQIPAGRVFNLWRQLPQLNRVEDVSGDLKAFVGCMQEVTNLLLSKLDRFGDILDPDFAPEAWLDLMLADLGNPFSFLLSAIEKRRLVQTLVAIYREKGTDDGIVNAIRFFLGIETTITTPAWPTGLLGLGKAKIGSTLILSSGSLTDWLTFVVHVPRSLSDDEFAKMDAIVDYMKRAECHYRIATPSAPAPPATTFWKLGTSRLGIETTLAP